MRPAKFHVHTIVRTPNGNDYGFDLLRQHYKHAPHHRQEQEQQQQQAQTRGAMGIITATGHIGIIMGWQHDHAMMMAKKPAEF